MIAGSTPVCAARQPRAWLFHRLGSRAARVARMAIPLCDSRLRSRVLGHGSSIHGADLLRRAPCAGEAQDGVHVARTLVSRHAVVAGTDGVIHRVLGAVLLIDIPYIGDITHVLDSPRRTILAAISTFKISLAPSLRLPVTWCFPIHPLSLWVVSAESALVPNG